MGTTSEPDQPFCPWMEPTVYAGASKSMKKESALAYMGLARTRPSATKIDRDERTNNRFRIVTPCVRCATLPMCVVGRPGPPLRSSAPPAPGQSQQRVYQIANARVTNVLHRSGPRL